jgi:hypothetical protein
MVKLIIQKNKHKYSKNQKFSLLSKRPGVIPLASNPGIGAWCSGLCGEEYFPSCQTARDVDSWRRFFSFSAFFGFMVCPLQVEAL